MPLLSDGQERIVMSLCDCLTPTSSFLALHYLTGIWSTLQHLQLVWNLRDTHVTLLPRQCSRQPYCGFGRLIQVICKRWTPY